MTEISNVYPKARIEAPGVPEPLLADVVADSVKDFFRESECWRYTVPSLLNWTTAAVFPALSAGTEIPTGTRIVRIDKVKYASDGSNLKDVPFYTRQHLDEVIPDWEVRTGNAPMGWTNDPTPDSPRIVPVATADVNTSVQVRVIIAPSTLTDVPDYFYNEYHDAWRWGALFRLMKMPGRDWTNPPLAQMYEKMYMDTIELAKSRVNADYGQPNQREMAYGGIGSHLNIGYNDYGQ